MMFLEFFIWGAWFVTMGSYLPTALHFTDPEIGASYATQSLGAIIAPFIIGLIADKFFSAQRILGILHLAGAALLFMAGRANGFSSFYPMILIYMIIYMPTLALVNSVSFRQLKDPSRQFGNIRLFGTIGWVVAGLIISYATNWEAQGLLRNTFYLAAGASAVLGIFSFTLPDTPPVREKNAKTTLSDILGLDALRLLKDKGYLSFFLTSILICIPLAFYYQMTNNFLSESGIAKPTGIMTLGQVSEVLCMLLLPVFLKRFGLKWTLILGIGAWALRYVLFSFGDTGAGMWMLILGIILHGICYDFFFVTGQIYTDFKAGEKVKSAAQGLITLATYGLGMMIGFFVAGLVGKKYTLPEGGHQWQTIWLIPACFALIILLIFALRFKNEKLSSTS
jgi:nucleoside transporter